jgi:hypothetical protein
MAKAIIEFDLNDPDDIKAHKRAIKSLDMALALWQISQIRKGVKAELEFNPENQSLSKYEIVDLAFDKIFEIFYEYKIDVDDLTS